MPVQGFDRHGHESQQLLTYFAIKRTHEIRLPLPIRGAIYQPELWHDTPPDGDISSFRKLIVGIKLQQLNELDECSRSERHFCRDSTVCGPRRQHPPRNLETPTREIFDGHRATCAPRRSENLKLASAQWMERVVDPNRSGFRTRGIMWQSSTIRTCIV
jgi:hypothetical protein